MARARKGKHDGTSPAPAAREAPPAGGADAIVVERLYKHYGDQFSLLLGFKVVADAIARLFGVVQPVTHVLEDLSFRVPAGRVVGFLGPNGAGKTTTLRCLLRLLWADHGHCAVLGHEMSAEYHEVLGRVGAVIEKPTLYEYLTGYENLRLLSFFHPSVDEDAVTNALKTAGLYEERFKKVSQYSTGMKQRLALAAAIVHEPEILILDEPTAGLDPRGQAEIWELVRSVTAAGRMTVFLSSHILHDIEQMCDYVVIIDRGRLIAAGPVADLVAEEQDVLRLSVSDVDRALALLEASEGVTGVHVEKAGARSVLLARVRRGEAGRIAPVLVEGGVALLAMEPVRKSLEEFFLSVTER